MFIPLKKRTNTIEIKKSVFITTAFPVKHEKQAKELIQKQREQHPKSNHVVWAYVVGDSIKQTARFFDNGEPGGTAGRPVLNVLQYSSLNNILITVVRYFGGIKLGRGGLVRAYVESATKVLKDIPKKELTMETVFRLICSYEHYEKIKRVLGNYGTNIVEERFETDVIIIFSVAENKFEDLKPFLINTAKGAIRIEELEKKG